MSAGSGASSTNGDWRQRFRSIWHVDFEFREDANHLPIPVCMYAREEHSGASVSLWRDELLRLTHGPFDTGPDSVMVAFASNAELACFLALGWPFPTNVLDPYVENIVTMKRSARGGLDCSTRLSCTIYQRGHKSIRTECAT